MANDTTKTTSTFSIEYPTTGYGGTPTWADLYGQAFEDIDSALADRLIEEEVEDVVDALLAGGDKVSVSYDDPNDALTIDTSALDDEEVRDEVGQLLTAGDGISVTVDDAGDSVTIALASHASTHEKGGADEITTLGDLQTDSLDTEKARTKSEPVYNVKHWGAVGDGVTDDRQSIQDAIDAANAAGGGTVYLPASNSSYYLESSGNSVVSADDADNSVEYALEMKSGVRIEGASRDQVTIETPATQVCSFWINGQSDIQFASLTIDDGQHDDPQPDSEVSGNPANVLKFGGYDNPSTGSTDILVRDCRITGGLRHGIDFQYCERAWVDSCVFDDAGADDSVSVSTSSKYVLVSDCLCINKARAGEYDPASFEAEDGSEWVIFQNCRSINNDSEGGGKGFVVGKSHDGKGAPSHHYVLGCMAVTPGIAGINIGGVADDGGQNVVIDNFTHFGSKWGIKLTTKDAKLQNVKISNSFIQGTNAEAFHHEQRGTNTSGTLEGLQMSNVTVKACGSADSTPAIEVPSTITDVRLSDINSIRCYKGFAVNSAYATLQAVEAKSCDGSGITLGVDATRARLTDCIAYNNGQTGAGQSDGIVINANKVLSQGCVAFDDQGTKTQLRSIQVYGTDCRIIGSHFGPSANFESVDNGGVDNRWSDNEFQGDSLVQRNGSTRLVRNGSGTNSGDPTSTGQWNGSGYEGAVVYDTSVARPYTEYQYIDGAWQSA